MGLALDLGFLEIHPRGLASILLSSKCGSAAPFLGELGLLRGPGGSPATINLLVVAGQLADLQVWDIECS